MADHDHAPLSDCCGMWPLDTGHCAECKCHTGWTCEHCGTPLTWHGPKDFRPTDAVEVAAGGGSPGVAQPVHDPAAVQRTRDAALVRGAKCATNPHHDKEGCDCFLCDLNAVLEAAAVAIEQGDLDER